MQKKIIFFVIYGILALVFVGYSLIITKNDQNQQDSNNNVDLLLSDFVWNSYNEQGNNTSRIFSAKSTLYNNGYYELIDNSIISYDLTGQVNWEITAYKINKQDDLLIFEEGLLLKSLQQSTGFAKYRLLGKAEFNLTTMILTTADGVSYTSDSVNYNAKSMNANLRTNKVDLGDSVKAIF